MEQANKFKTNQFNIITAESDSSNRPQSDLGRENRQVKVTVSGKNIGYGSTCACMVQAALVILQEGNR
jgi:hypothetical protein